MGKLDHLKIKKAPAAFAGWAKQFNQQVDLLGSIEGGPGIDIQVAHSPRKIISHPQGHKPKEQPRGKILLTLRPSAVNGLGVSGGGGNTNGVNVNVVTFGFTGAVVSTITVPSASIGSDYPTSFTTCSNSAFVSIGSALTVQKTNSSRVGQMTADDDAGLYLSDGTNVFGINYSALSHDIAIKTFVGCNSGSPGNYLVVASDFF